MTGNALVLVEPGAHRPGGHHHGALLALAKAHPKTVVITPYGVPGEMWEQLRAAGVRVSVPAGVSVAPLAVAALALESVAVVGRHVLRSRRWPNVLRRLPHQVTLMSRCMAEAACVRTARRFGPGAVVVLSAGEALHGLAGLLGGPHSRFVHEVVTTEDAALRLLGRLARAGERRVQLFAPTEAVRTDLAGRFPGLRVRVRPFAVADPEDRLTGEERRRAREAFGIPGAEAAVCLVGGWWPYKDIGTVGVALNRLDGPLHVLVTGTPLHTDVLDRWRALPAVRLHVVPGPATQAQVREVYAASDAAVVVRRAGVAKESGLVVDAVRLGVPLLVSEHDPALTGRLAGRPWVRTFPAGDGGALAALLRDLAWSPLVHPSAGVGAELGVPTAAAQAAFLYDTASKGAR
ncbi:hypothetical protein [Streptomyces sp. AC512_CC834]|uniref:hypothetical protein n=1 Tax=Streptomyces sp. AC512_CC834 TaxID=2823691 RepID=UPI001C26750E|nr:hypothetical protein [Streptomyces sp. AC512_CC834]